ncbi:NUDIX domain-containing protein [Hypomontagnella submonticulosa]|nr:NUDIX domain-containing protein [Hypomontagnella submonticulosa]
MSSPPRTYLDLIKICDNFAEIDIRKTAYAEPPDQVFYQLLLPDDPRPHGFLLPDVVAKMPWTQDFEVSAPDARPRTVQVLDFSNGQNTTEAVNAALLSVVQKAIDAGAFASLTRRRSGEDFRIPGARYPFIRLRRAAAGLFGIASLGAHMTMYTRTPEGEIKIWVPRRSAHLSTYPGKLDSTVAGGVRADESPYECILHEASEEASIPKSLVQQLAKPCGAITYIFTSDPGAGQEHGIMAPVVLYVYDMEVDHTITPKPQDDEVQEFCLWDVQQIKEAMFRGEFKTNCASVMIDFFIRHGIITDDNEPDYLEIITRLHRPLPVPTSAF